MMTVLEEVLLQSKEREVKILEKIVEQQKIQIDHYETIENLPKPKPHWGRFWVPYLFGVCLGTPVGAFLVTVWS